ncbi:hypothetical protein BH09BAC4_BH09BAC4_28150 [soil metagenome]
MARQKADIDWLKVEEMLRAYADGTDIADALGIHEATLHRACKRQYGKGLDELKRECRAGTRHMLRMTQLKEARGYDYVLTDTEKDAHGNVKKITTRTIKREPNTSMLIFLGKNLLGQTDKLDARLQIPDFIIVGEGDDIDED